MGVLGGLCALVIALGALRNAKAWEKQERRRNKPPEPKREKQPTGFGGPWGD